MPNSLAQTLREQVDLNEIAHEQPLAWWQHLWHCYRNPLNLLLTLLAVISYLTEDMKAALVIGSMVELPIRLLVPGELIHLSAGDMILSP